MSEKDNQIDKSTFCWVLSGGFAGTWTLVLILFGMTTSSMTSLNEKVTDIDRRLCRIEGIMSTKDFCVAKEEIVK